MARASDKWGIFHENLIDAGCDEELTGHCMRLAKENRNSELHRVLVNYRVKVLDTVHESQAKLDCLDFLLYQIKKQM